MGGGMRRFNKSWSWFLVLLRAGLGPGQVRALGTGEHGGITWVCMFSPLTVWPRLRLSKSSTDPSEELFVSRVQMLETFWNMNVA